MQRLIKNIKGSFFLFILAFLITGTLHGQTKTTEQFQTVTERQLRNLQVKQKFLNQLTSTLLTEAKRRKAEGANLSSIRGEEDLAKLKPTDLLATAPSHSDNVIATPPLRTFEQTVAEYYVNLLQAEDMHVKFIRSANADQKQRMFNWEYTQALINYGTEEYELAAMQFDAILKSYGYKEIDDVLFYRAESNYFLRNYETAKKDYQLIIDEYRNSEFINEAIWKATLIGYVFDNSAEVAKYVSILEKLSLPADSKILNRGRMIGGVQLYRHGQLEEAIKIFYRIPKTSDFYYRAQFVTGQSQYQMETYLDCRKTFAGVSVKENPDRDLRNDAYLMQGFLAYQLKQYGTAIDNFRGVSDDYYRYDLALLGIIWSKFQQGDLASVKGLDSLFVREYAGSSKIFEARSLFGYLKQQDALPEESLDNFEFVFNARDAKSKWDYYLSERDSLTKLVDKIQHIRDQAFLASSRESYLKDIVNEGDLNKLAKKFDKTPAIDQRTLSAGKEELRSIYVQLSELDRLEEAATKQKDREGQKKIQEIRNRLSYLLAFNPYVLNSMSVYWESIKQEDQLNTMLTALESQQGISARSYSSYQDELRILMYQLNELDRLEKIAESRKDKNSLHRIERLRTKLYNLISANPFVRDTSLTVNFFADYPAATRISEIVRNQEARRYLDKNSVAERTQVERNIDLTLLFMDEAKRSGNAVRYALLRKSYDQLLNLRRLFNQHYATVRMTDLPEDDSQFQKWTDYAAYGISNVNFGLKTQMDKRRLELNANVTNINEILKQRKKQVDVKVDILTRQLNQTVRELRKDEFTTERKQRNEQFQQEYYQRRLDEGAASGGGTSVKADTTNAPQKESVPENNPPTEKPPNEPKPSPIPEKKADVPKK